MNGFRDRRSWTRRRPKSWKIGQSAATVPVETQKSKGVARNRGTMGVKSGVPLGHHLNSVQTTIISGTMAMWCRVLLSCPRKIPPFQPKTPISDLALKAAISCMDTARKALPKARTFYRRSAQRLPDLRQPIAYLMLFDAEQMRRRNGWVLAVIARLASLFAAQARRWSGRAARLSDRQESGVGGPLVCGA